MQRTFGCTRRDGQLREAAAARCSFSARAPHAHGMGEGREEKKRRERGHKGEVSRRLEQKRGM